MNSAESALMTDIHGIKPALPVGADPGWWIWAALAVALLAAIALLGRWWWRRRRRIETTPEAVLISPEVEAYARLDALAADDHSDMKVFYFGLSAILRRYVARRYGIPAAEMTTEELLPCLDRLAIAADMAQQLKAFCLRADPIKFAAAAADGRRLADDVAFGREFVRQTTLTAIIQEQEKSSAASPDRGLQIHPER